MMTMRTPRGLILMAGVSLAAFAAAAPAATDPATRSVDAFLATTHLNPRSPAEFTAACDAYLARAAALRSDLERETGPARIETTFRRSRYASRIRSPSHFERP